MHADEAQALVATLLERGQGDASTASSSSATTSRWRSRRRRASRRRAIASASSCSTRALDDELRDLGFVRELLNRVQTPAQGDGPRVHRPHPRSASSGSERVRRIVEAHRDALARRGPGRRGVLRRGEGDGGRGARARRRGGGSRRSPSRERRARGTVKRSGRCGPCWSGSCGVGVGARVLRGRLSKGAPAARGGEPDVDATRRAPVSVDVSAEPVRASSSTTRRATCSSSRRRRTRTRPTPADPLAAYAAAGVHAQRGPTIEAAR